MDSKRKSFRSGRTKPVFLIALCLVILVVLFWVDLIAGPVRIPVKDVFAVLFGSGHVDDVWKTVLLDFRIPKAVTAIVAGSSLAASGLQMQTIFRNPLAGPDVLGISSGAGLGVALVVMGFGRLFIHSGMLSFGGWVQITAAWLGAASVLLLVLLVSLRVRDIMTILILGILFGSAISALVSILQYFSEQTMLRTYVIWTMGSLAITTAQLRIMLMGIAAGFLVSFLSVKKLNALLLGETYAMSMGVDLKVSRIMIFVSTSILTGSVTAFCGPLGFVGIAIPHLARLFFRSADHRILLPGSMLLGGIVLLVSDLLTQIPPQETQLPINAVTALLGIPIVVWVILRNQHLIKVS